jgi:glycosyltransferase involved in cell wall biosynthesis
MEETLLSFFLLPYIYLLWNISCENMKILILCSTLDLSKPFGATPALWQLFKGLYEEGYLPLIIPYHGHAIDNFWWCCFENPNYISGMLLEKVMSSIKSSTMIIRRSRVIPYLARAYARPRLFKVIKKILQEKSDVEALIIMGVPLNHLNGLATEVRGIKNIPILYYDLDIPTSLPSQGGFTFNYYGGSDLTEYDSFIIASEGASEQLMEMGARQVDVVHYGVDPDVYRRLEIKEEDIDIFFFGNGGRARARNIKTMIAEPSRALNNHNFLVSGRNFNVDLGNSRLIPALSFSEWRNYCCRAKINLNVARDEHARIFATSSSRPFELAAMQCCIVSAPYNGIEKWFDVKREICIANSSRECIELYQMLIDDPELRMKMGTAACERVKKEHTSRHRAKQIIDIVRKLKVS